MTRVQTEMAKFEVAIRETINKHRGPHLPYGAIVGVLVMVSNDIDREASCLPTDGER